MSTLIELAVSIGHSMSIRPLDEQKCPLDIQMSIRPWDQLKCPMDELNISVCPMDKWTFECPMNI